MKPIDGMKTTPMYHDRPEMMGAWASLLRASVEEKKIVKAFKQETGHDIMDVLNARGINAMIDQTTGHEKAVVIEWADFITKYVWGEEKCES